VASGGPLSATDANMAAAICASSSVRALTAAADASSTLVSA
jgi:hypothetical protein